MKKAKILVIDDNKSILSALEILLQFECDDVFTIHNPNQITSFSNLKQIDIVLLDMNFKAGVNTGNEGLYWLRELKKRAPHIAVVMMTAYGAIELAVTALKQGASDFVLKPWDNKKIVSVLKSVYNVKTNENKNDKKILPKQVANVTENIIIGNSKALHEVLLLTRKVAKTDVNVLISGENGTGKELLARELHNLSNRKEHVFISVDVGTLSENLFESELFGHTKGAFTDAKEDRVGKFEAANGGTLFLDEIGNLSLSVQAKLLTAIQNKTIVRVGTNKVIKVDIRLVCATNCNLDEMVAKGLFREDLLYRINTIYVESPPLRNRGDDILILANFFVNKYGSKYNRLPLKINKTAADKLLNYHWPGNIRELGHVIERAVILCEGNVLTPQDFLLKTTSFVVKKQPVKTLHEMEQQLIEQALIESDGNYTAAASKLGVTRQTLYNKVKR